MYRTGFLTLLFFAGSLFIVVGPTDVCASSSRVGIHDDENNTTYHVIPSTVRFFSFGCPTGDVSLGAPGLALFWSSSNFQQFRDAFGVNSDDSLPSGSPYIHLVTVGGGNLYIRKTEFSVVSERQNGDIEVSPSRLEDRIESSTANIQQLRSVPGLRVFTSTLGLRLGVVPENGRVAVNPRSGIIHLNGGNVPDTPKNRAKLGLCD